MQQAGQRHGRVGGAAYVPAGVGQAVGVPVGGRASSLSRVDAAGGDAEPVGRLEQHQPRQEDQGGQEAGLVQHSVKE